MVFQQLHFFFETQAEWGERTVTIRPLLTTLPRLLLCLNVHHRKSRSSLTRLTLWIPAIHCQVPRPIGALWLFAVSITGIVNYRLCLQCRPIANPEHIFSAPKMHSWAEAQSTGETQQIFLGNKWNGTNIMVYKYQDDTGQTFITAGPRGHAFLKDTRYSQQLTIFLTLLGLDLSSGTLACFFY